MKKFVFLAHGDMDRTPDGQQAHMQWWASMKDHVIDSGNPLMNGRTVSRDGTVTEVAGEPALGYSIIEAESLDAAIALLDTCPMDMWVYEAMPM
jgi:uncharacterized protein YciI